MCDILRFGGFVTTNGLSLQHVWRGGVRTKEEINQSRFLVSGVETGFGTVINFLDPGLGKHRSNC